MSNEDPGRLAELEQENAELRGENEELRTQLEQRGDDARLATKAAVGFGGRMLLGRRLRTSFRDWLKAKSLRDPLPAEETADVLAAIVRRVVRVGIVGLLVALVPGFFLLWQNLLLNRQIDQQAEDTLIVRRTQLLATIYEEDCEPTRPSGANSETDPICRPRSNARARQEAVIAFSKIERNRDQPPDLSFAKLNGLHLTGAKLNGAHLMGAELTASMLVGADLSGALFTVGDLRGASFMSADLSGAILSGANLNDANLSGANLKGAKFSDAGVRRLTAGSMDLSTMTIKGPAIISSREGFRANLSGANLAASNLSGADLSQALNLTQEQIAVAHGDSRTQLPPGLKHPVHWH